MTRCGAKPISETEIACVAPLSSTSQGRLNKRRTRMKGIIASLAVAIALGNAPLAASESLGRYTGNIALSTKSVGFIVGAEWGSGTVTLRDGRNYQLNIRTLKVGMAGLESVSANGRVYNLDPRRPQDLEGTYASMGAGVTIGGGVGVQRMKNDKGVIIELRETAQGVAAKIASSGIAIRLR